MVTTVPVFYMSDPEVQFIVEVNASDIGMGQSPSVRVLTKVCTHEYTFPSLTSLERNCDVGDQELMAVRLALLVCRHWFEGGQHHLDRPQKPGLYSTGHVVIVP